ETAPVRDAGYERRVANIVVARPAVLARALALAEGDQHAVALGPARHARAGLLDDAAELVTEDVRHWQLDAEPAPVTRPEMPVGAADAVRLDANQRAVRPRRRIGHLTNGERLANSLEHGGAHRWS